MDPITRLPIIQIDHLLDRPKRNEQRSNHHRPLDVQIFHLHEHTRHERQQQAHNRVQEPDREPLCPELHTRALVEEYQLVRVVPVRHEHGHLPNDVVHRARYAEEVDEHRTGQPDFRVVEQSLTHHNLLHSEWDPNENSHNNQRQLLLGEKRWAVDRADDEIGLGLDEMGHRLGEPGEVSLVHLIGLFRGLIRADESDVREGIDAKEREAGLCLLELDVAEEELAVRGGIGVLVVGDEGFGEERELAMEGLQLELGLFVELARVEEDEERVGPGGLGRGQEARDGAVV